MAVESDTGKTTASYNSVILTLQGAVNYYTLGWAALVKLPSASSPMMEEVRDDSYFQVRDKSHKPTEQ